MNKCKNIYINLTILFKILIPSETKLVTLTESFTELICSIIHSGTLLVCVDSETGSAVASFGTILIERTGMGNFHHHL